MVKHSQKKKMKVSVTKDAKLKSMRDFRIGVSFGADQMSANVPDRTATSKQVFGGNIDEEDIEFAARREPIGHRIVFGVAHDVFDKWFEIENIADPEDVDLDKNVQKELERLHAKDALTRTLVFERIHGYAALGISYGDAAEEFENPVNNPSHISDLVVYSKKDVTKIDDDTDPESDNYGYPEFIYVKGESNEDIKIHMSRFVWCSTRLLDHRYKGLSALEVVHDDLTAFRNMRWSLTMAMVRHGFGIPDVTITGATPKTIDDFIDSGAFDNLNVMKYFVHGEDKSLEFKGAEGVAFDPMKFVKPVVESISSGSMIPEPMLRGAQAGELTGSEVNEREYFKLVSDCQSRLEPFVKGVVNAVLKVLFKENVPDYRIKWKGAYEMNELDKANLELTKTQTAVQKLKYMTVNEVRAAELGENKDVPEGNVILGIVELEAKASMFPTSPTADSATVTNMQNDFKASLQKIYDDVKTSKLTFDEAMLRAEMVVDEHIQSMKRITKTHLEARLNKPIKELSPENEAHMIALKRQYVADFRRILEDSGYGRTA
jgi:hypothetical protein